MEIFITDPAQSVSMRTTRNLGVVEEGVIIGSREAAVTLWGGEALRKVLERAARSLRHLAPPDCADDATETHNFGGCPVKGEVDSFQLVPPYDAPADCTGLEDRALITALLHQLEAMADGRDPVTDEQFSRSKLRERAAETLDMVRNSLATKFKTAQDQAEERAPAKTILVQHEWPAEKEAAEKMARLRARLAEALRLGDPEAATWNALTTAAGNLARGFWVLHGAIAETLEGRIPGSAPLRSVRAMAGAVRGLGVQLAKLEAKSGNEKVPAIPDSAEAKAKALQPELAEVLALSMKGREWTWPELIRCAIEKLREAEKTRQTLAMAIGGRIDSHMPELIDLARRRFEDLGVLRTAVINSLVDDGRIIEASHGYQFDARTLANMVRCRAKSAARATGEPLCDEKLDALRAEFDQLRAGVVSALQHIGALPAAVKNDALTVRQLVGDMREMSRMFCTMRSKIAAAKSELDY